MTPTLRPRRIWAVTLRDLRQRTGKKWYRLPATALALLLPAGVLGFSIPKPVTPMAVSESGTQLPVVGGEVPQALADRLQKGPGSDVSLRGQSPVIVTGLSIPREVREVLATLPEADKLKRKRFRPPIRLPGRSLLLALLAISLLTGPLAETLPGERSRNTLEVLLSAGISRAELVGGKWLAWTMAASSTALLAAFTTVAVGKQTPGLWILGLPVFIGTGVALGLWLVRRVADIVGGAAAPMRVLPIVSMGLAGVAYALSSLHPLLGPAVPIGGILLVAGDVFVDPVSVFVACVVSALWVIGALAITARDLDRSGDSRVPRFPNTALPIAAGTMAWWLPVVSPGIWTLAGNPGAAGSLAGAATGGGLALLLVAIVSHARTTVPQIAQQQPASSLAGGNGEDIPSFVSPSLIGLGLGILVGSLAMVLPSGSNPLLHPVFAARLSAPFEAATLGGFLPVVVGALGQGALFFGVIAARGGAILAATAWLLIIASAAPVHGALSAVAAAYAWSKGGTLAATLCLLAAALFP